MCIFTREVNGDIFEDFVCTTLFPTLQPFNGTNSRSVVVLDNASIHHLDRIQDIIHSSGALVRFVPPYSPDLMPLEVFSKIKYFIKANEHIFLTTSSPRLLIAMAFASVMPTMFVSVTSVMLDIYTSIMFQSSFTTIHKGYTSTIVRFCHFLFSCLITSTITLLCSSYSAAVSAPISNTECSSLNCSIYLLRSETALPGELLVLAVVGVATTFCFITSLIEFANPVNASFSVVEADQQTFQHKTVVNLVVRQCFQEFGLKSPLPKMCIACHQTLTCALSATNHATLFALFSSPQLQKWAF